MFDVLFLNTYKYRFSLTNSYHLLTKLHQDWVAQRTLRGHLIFRFETEVIFLQFVELGVRF